jgi:hypothetical protein
LLTRFVIADRRARELDLPHLGLDPGVFLDLPHERRDVDLLELGLHAELERRVHERALDHLGDAAQVPLQEVGRPPPHGGILLTQAAEREPRRAQRIAELVGDERQVFGGLPAQLLIALADVLRDRVGDPLVQGLRDDGLLVEGDVEAGVARHRQDALMQEAVLLDHLGDVEPEAQALRAVLLGVAARAGERDRIRVERGDQLVDEGGHPIEQLGAGDGGPGDLSLDLRGPASEEVVAPGLEETM